MKIGTMVVCGGLLMTACGAFAADKTHWVGTWASAPMKMAATDKVSFENTTVRDVVHVSLGGERVRVKISNEFGASALLIGGAHVALNGGAGKIKVETDRAVTFGGQATVSIPPGAFALSDPVALHLPALSDLVVSIYLPEQTLPVLTNHALGMTTMYHASGNAMSAVEMEKPTKQGFWMLLKGVDVEAPDGAAAVVTLGDSITDGAHSTPNHNGRWPDVLAARLHANKATAEVAVLNEGISGNRILNEVAGTNALARFDRDVLAQSGVKYVVFLEGINDIRHANAPKTPAEVVTAQQLIWGMAQVVERAHARGIKVYGATLTPYGGSANQEAHGESMRQAINTWIRTSGIFDAVIDFDKVTADPAHPGQFLNAFDSGDHLHPSDAGYKAMAESVDLRLFQ